MGVVGYLRKLSISQKIFAFIMLVFGCVFYTIVIANHYYFRTYASDYAVYNFAFWDYAHFHIRTIPCLQVFGHMQIKLIQGHFSLTLMYLVPFYWMLNWLTGSYTLLILQVTCLLWSAWALYKLIKLKTNDDWLAVISVLYYFLLQARYSSLGSDFHEVTIMCYFVPIFLLYFEMRKYVTVFIVFLLLLFSREDMPLWFIFIFAVLITQHWKEHRIIWFCIAGIFCSIAYFIILFKVFLPMVETSHLQYELLFQYSNLGATPWEAFIHILKHPIDTFKLLYMNPSSVHVLDGIKEEFYMVYLISGAFLLFLRPQYFIWFVPLIAQKMFNDQYVRWSIIGYYGDQVAILLPVSIFLVISIFKIKWIRYSLAILVCMLAFSVTYYKMNPANMVAPWGYSVKENIFDSNFFHPGYNAAKIHRDLKMIPPDAKICASSSILPQLSQRLYAYEFPDVEDADYIAVFMYNDYYLIDDKTYSKEITNYISNPLWCLVAYDYPFLLMKKRVPEK